MKISIFGVGYVGLVTGTCLANVGHDVICVDIDEHKVAKLNAGLIPIYEPGLEPLVREGVAGDRLRFTTCARDAVTHGEVIFIAVGTPPDEDGSADLRHVLAVARTIGQHIDGYRVVVGKSTVPVGTAERVRGEIRAQLAARGVTVPFDVCSNPEFLKEGAAIEDFTRAARIIVGADSEHAAEMLRRVYAPYNRNHDKIIEMDIRSAELTKYAANAMLATKISFMNEMARIAEELDADIEQVRLGIGSDPRIGYHFIYPGCGYGGSCFPKDIRALAKIARSCGVAPTILESVEAVNNRQKHWPFEKLKRALGPSLAGKRVALWGLSFKPNTDDMREAPSLALIDALLKEGASISAYDPEAMDECRRIYGDNTALTLAASPDAALAGCDAAVICTEWKSFRAVDPSTFVKRLKQPIVVDGRNLFDPGEMQAAGIRYFAVGRPSRA